MRILLLFLLFTSYSFGQNTYIIEQHLIDFLGKNQPFRVSIGSYNSQFPRHSEWGDDGFGYELDRFNISIYGNTPIAIENAQYFILENYFEFHFFSASGLNAPNKVSATFQKTVSRGFNLIRSEEIPAFTYREVFYGETKKEGYAEWNLLTRNQEQRTFENHTGWGLWVHTLHKLLPPKIYFESHPEYYALRNGFRVKDQVCLSNPNVLEIVIENLRKEMASKPSCKYWSVSQMDNYNFCECDACKKTDSNEHSHAGTLIQFVNTVAVRFPEKVISTLAYQYSRKAPTITKPLSNVNIMLCSIEENRAKSLKGSGFENDLKTWSKLTHNIIVWDYVINFSHLVGPFPNWSILGPNVQLFQQYQVPMVFEQGYNTVGSEMQPLRAWLISKLLWNPNYNVDSLTNVFLTGYYQTGAKVVRDWLRYQQKTLNASGIPLTLYEPPIAHVKGYLNPKGLKKYYGKLLKIQRHSTNYFLNDRIEMVMQPIRYALLEISKFPQSGSFIYSRKTGKIDSFYVQLLNDFVVTSKLFGPPILHEMRLSPIEYKEETLHYWKNVRCNHKAINKPILYLSPPDNPYTDGEALVRKWNHSSSLVNGYHGDKLYQVSWLGWWGRDAEIIIDLKQAETIHSIKTHFLENNEAWIVGPEYIEIAIPSEQNEEFDTSSSYTWTTIMQQKNELVGQQLPNKIYPLEIELSQPLITRFIKLKIKNPGLLPGWRGVNNKGWLFLDEIELY
jgi:hypothetical protein